MGGLVWNRLKLSYRDVANKHLGAAQWLLMDLFWDISNSYVD
jgi:hypothetical protein